jgi:hypothetical protein
MNRIHLTFEQAAQTAHVGVGAAVVALATAKGFPHAQLYSSLGMVVITAVKEWWWDVQFEDLETQGSAGVDFLFWMVGVAVANLILWL